MRRVNELSDLSIMRKSYSTTKGCNNTYAVDF